MKTNYLRKTRRPSFCAMVRNGVFVASFTLLLTISVIYRMEPNRKSILLGMSTALSGPARDLGLNMQSKITREKIITALESLGEFDIGLGEILELGPTSHQASHAVWPSIIRNGKAVPFAWTDMKQN